MASQTSFYLQNRLSINSYFPPLSDKFRALYLGNYFINSHSFYTAVYPYTFHYLSYTLQILHFTFSPMLTTFAFRPRPGFCLYSFIRDLNSQISSTHNSCPFIYLPPLDDDFFRVSCKFNIIFLEYPSTAVESLLASRSLPSFIPFVLYPGSYTHSCASVQYPHVALFLDPTSNCIHFSISPHHIPSLSELYPNLVQFIINQT